MTDDHTERLTLRCRRLNAAPYRATEGAYVLCWLQQTLRGRSNPVIDAAVALGERLGRPVVVYHGLGNGYPHASHRLHRFILEASRGLELDVTARGLRFLRHVEREGKIEKGLVYRLAARAAAVVLDDQAAFVGRWQATRVAGRLDVAVLAVDGMRLVPDAAIGDICRTTAGFRQRVNAVRTEWLAERFDLDTTLEPFDGELATTHDALGVTDTSEGIDARSGAEPHDDIDDLAKAAGVDMSVPPVAWYRGDRAAGLAHLAWAAEAVVPGYAARRNDPSAVTTTHLSPWLHFGVLAPHDVVQAVDAGSASSRDTWKFLDELLVWREYFHHTAAQADDPASYETLPAAARRTLAAHADDPRPHLHSLSALVHGETDDPVWNAAQRAFLADGWMHNNLRMYWGKKLIEWTPSPEVAWRTACYLNDRFSLDGRDPATYGNLRWCFGASRPASEAPIYGRVARRGDGAIRRRAGDAWIERAAERAVPRVAIPDTIDTVARPQASGTNAFRPQGTATRRPPSSEA